MIIIVYFKQDIAYAFIKEKQNTLILQSLQNIATFGMYWTQRWYLWDTIKKRIKIPLIIVIKVLAFKSINNKSIDVVFSLIVIKNKKIFKILLYLPHSNCQSDIWYKIK